ncbi:MAG: hypothetical protein V1809_12965, partial [Planctomycetota bacterium]
SSATPFEKGGRKPMHKIKSFPLISCLNRQPLKWLQKNQKSMTGQQWYWINNDYAPVGYGGVFGLVIGVIVLAGILWLSRCMESGSVSSKALHGVLLVAILALCVGFLGMLSKLVLLVSSTLTAVDLPWGYAPSRFMIALIPMWEGLVAALYFTFAYVYLRNQLEDTPPAANPPVESARQE